ncbi:MAG: histidinol dehydrogenase [Nitrospira sp.]|nr:MAG: histidinol dehydrogenase [Nitrospira sp.]
MKVISSTDRTFKAMVKRATSRSSPQSAKVDNSVRTILKAVQRAGDSAAARYTKKFDRVSLKPAQFRVGPEQVKEAYYKIRKDEGDALRYAAQRITLFHERQRTRTWMYQDDGATLGQMIQPLDAVGLYVPGGKAVYPSTILMTAIPARVAGVPRVVMCTPPSKEGISPYVLVAADIAGVNEIYQIGGVQAIGAMAYGTKTLARVDKVVGPGNVYVAAAKRMIFGDVDIDMVAGPSELLVVADESSNPSHVAADLLCEAEHDEEAQVFRVTPSARLARQVVGEIQSRLKKLGRAKILEKSLAHHAVAFVVASLDEAIDLANEIAPEHLTLSVDRPFEYLERIRHAGALFLGRYTPPAVADYVAGPNHVLPTGGTARFFSPLSLDDYVKKSNIISYSKEELSKVRQYVARMSQMEGLDAHGQSMESRYS